VHATICSSASALPLKCRLLSPETFAKRGVVRNPTPKKNVIVYWLTPAKAERDLFCDIIQILCKQFAAPNFDPHLTLLTTTEDGPSPKEVLQKIEAAPIRLPVQAMDFSSEFRKTLFVPLRPNRSLQDLVADLGRATKSRPKRLADPHVSLLYKTFAPNVLKELARTIKLPFGKVTFNSISAVRSVNPIETKAEVEAWEVVAKKSLRE
jgi:2'-5' RNA ligase